MANEECDLRRWEIGRVEKWLLCCILGLSAFLLWFDLESLSLWGDEGWSVYSARLPLRTMLRWLPRGDPHPPLSYLVLHSWIRFFGEGEAGMRWLFTLPALGSVLMAYLLGRRLYSDGRVGVVAAYLLAVSPFLVMFGRMLRYYSFGLFFGALSIYAFLGLRERWSARRVTFYVLATLLMMYSCYLTFTLLLVQNFIGFVWRRAHLGIRRWLFTQALLVVGYAPWWGVLASQVIGQTRGEFGGSIADLNRSIAAIPLKLAYSLYAFAAGETLFPWRWWASGPLAAALLLALSGLRHRIDRRAAFLIGLVVVAILGVAGITTYIAPRMSFIYTPARASFALIFFWVLIGAGAVALRRRIYLVAVLLVVSVVNAYSLVLYYRGVDFLMPVYAVPWKRALADVEKRCRTGEDAVLLADEDIVLDYYMRHREYPFRRIKLSWDVLEQGMHPDPLVVLQNRPPSRCHLLVTGRDSTASPIRPELLGWIEANYRKSDEGGYVPIDATYRRVKRWMLKREPYEYKLRRLEYRRRSGAGE